MNVLSDKADSYVSSNIEAIDDPHRLAENCLRELWLHADGPIIRRWNAGWYIWNGYRYVFHSDEEVSQIVNGWLRTAYKRLNYNRLKGHLRGSKKAPCDQKPRGLNPLKATKTTLANVLTALMSLDGIALHSSVELNSWVGAEADDDDREYIALENGLLDVEARLGGDDSPLRGHSPNWFSTVCLPYEYQPQASCEAWKKFLERNLESDAERIALLQEWFGYCLVRHLRFQVFMILVGDGCNGKSVVCAVLTAVLGEDNVSNVPLEAFNGRFTLNQTLGKLLNVAGEVDQIKDVAEGILKSFTSGDRMMFDRKGIAPIEAVPTARLMLATNHLPEFRDTSSGIWRRMKVLPFRVEIREHEKIHGMDNAKWWQEAGELPGILNWALEGLARLCRHNKFTEPALCVEALEEHRGECDPARKFLQEHCRHEPGQHVIKSKLYDAYCQWCGEIGKPPVSNTRFGLAVGRLFPHVKGTRQKFGPKGHQREGYPDVLYVGDIEGTAVDDEAA